MYKLQIIALAIAAIASVAMCDSDESGGQKGQRAPLTIVYGDAEPSYRPRPTQTYVAQPAPAYNARPAKYNAGSYERGDNAKYAFAYKVLAGGYGGRGGYGDDSKEGSYGKGYDRTSEFGHSETRDYGKTNGKYFVQLPDGRLQTVEYYVSGDSGYIAKVTYSGDKAPAAYDN